MKEKYRRIVESVYEQFLSKDGFERQRKEGVFARQYGDFEQIIAIFYEKASGRHYYKLCLHIGNPKVDKLCADLAQTKKQKQVLIDFSRQDISRWKYIFYMSDDEARLARHICHVIREELYPELTQYSDYGRIIRAYERKERVWFDATKEACSDEQEYKMMAVYLLSGYVSAAQHMADSITGKKAQDWLKAQMKNFQDKRDYQIFFTGHEADKYNRWFINPDKDTVKENILRMTGGYNESTAFLIWEEDGSYLQMGGTPSGYTVEIRIYGENGSFVHKKARYHDFADEEIKEAVIYIDGFAVTDQNNRILTGEDAAACMIAFGERKVFPGKFAWDDITDWFIEK